MAGIMEGTHYCDLVWNTNENREKTVVFDRVISGRYIALDHVDILWYYDNIKLEKDSNYVSTDDGSGYSKLTLNDGYYTFKAIVKKLKEKDINLTYDKNTLKSKVETKFPLKLFKELEEELEKLREELKNAQNELEELRISCFELKLGNSEKQRTIRKLICILREEGLSLKMKLYLKKK